MDGTGASEDLVAVRCNGAELEMFLGTRQRESGIEERTQAIARELFARIGRQGPWPLTPTWFDEKLLDWSTSDEHLKVQLFRFIDALPALGDDKHLVEHLGAYFADDRSQPWLVRTAAGWLRPEAAWSRLIARIVRAQSSRLAKRFIAGTTPEEVLRTVTRLRQRQQAFTLDLLGEATVAEKEADAYLERYLAMLDQLSHAALTWPEVPLLDRAGGEILPRVNLSVKISALFSQFDPIDPKGSLDGVRARLATLFREARKRGAHVTVDMEHYTIKDLTLAVFCELLGSAEFRDWPHAGIAIQAYLLDTDRDLRELADWVHRRGTPIWVRLVKGAYWDSETVLADQQHWPCPVYRQKWQSDAAFERAARFLIAEHAWLRPALASHNVRSLAHGLAVAEFAGLDASAIEIQMLHGMADAMKPAFVERGLRLRVYTPFGDLLPGMAYLVRRLLENTSNGSFLRATSANRKSLPDLTSPPRPPRPQAAVAIIAQQRNTTMSRLATPLRAVETLPAFTNEPLVDFAQAFERDALRREIQNARGAMNRDWMPKLAKAEPKIESWHESFNPANREVLGRVGFLSAEEVHEAVEAAVRVWPAWSRTHPSLRAGKLLDLAERMRRARRELSAWIVLESGKGWREADADVAEAIDFCEYYARSMLELADTRARPLPGESNDYRYRSRGPTAVIAPWNFPLAILCGMSVAALVTGNPVLLKPAEQTSIIAARFFELLEELDLPPGVAQFLPGQGESVGAALVQHPKTSVIAFTGSLAVGLQILRVAAEVAPGQIHLKQAIVELGGKNAILVDEDADLDEAVRGVVASAFGYQGQKCSACSRVIVVGAIHDAFLDRLAAATRSLSIGPPEDPTHTVGPVIDAETYDRLQSVLRQAATEARVVVGPETLVPGEGYYLAPHLFADVPADSILRTQELFGPILAVLRAQTLEEAIALGNETSYALTGGLYSRNPRSIAEVRDRLEVGNLYINRKITGALVDCQPFGGHRLSGVGSKAGGPDYLRYFLTPQTITENTLRRGFAPSEQDNAS